MGDGGPEARRLSAALLEVHGCFVLASKHCAVPNRACTLGKASRQAQ